LQGPPSTNIKPFNSLDNNQVNNIIMMISNSTFAHWLLVMDTPDGAEEATETRNAWHVISKDFSTGTPNGLLASLENTLMAAILI
jgi:hypothetical protein